MLPADGVIHRLLQPGLETTIAVRVYGRDGHPMEGRDVVFAAPRNTSLGQWADAPPDTPLVVRAVTDADGVAQAVWRAGEALGPYFLSVLSDADTGHQQFAITNVSEPPEALDVDAARAQLTADHGVAEPWSRLYGPFYLPAGWTMRGDSELLQGSTTQLDITASTWLFWIDTDPRARWSHASKFVLMDAATGVTTVVDQSWWPQVRAPESADWLELIPPYRQLDGLLSEPIPVPQPVPDPVPIPLPAPGPEPAVKVVRVTSAHPRLSAKPDPEACALILFGSDEHGMRRDADQMRAFFRDELTIPEDHIVTNSDADGDQVVAKPSDVDRMVQELCTKGCKKVYVYLSSHGASGTFQLANESEHDGDSTQDAMAYDALLRRIQACGEGMTVNLIIDACSAGTSIRILQGQGVGGNVYTASGLTGASKFNYFGGYFSGGLLDAWRNEESDADGDGVDLDEAFRHLRQSGSEDQLAGGPMTSKIFPGSLPSIQLPDLVIADPTDANTNPVTVVVRRPKDALGPLRGSVSIDQDGLGIANVVDGSDPQARQIQLDAGVDEVSVQILGLAPGFTTYKATLSDEQQKQFRGQAAIRVGAGFIVTPAAIETAAGQTVVLTVSRSPEQAQADGLIHIDIDPVDKASADVAEPDLTVTLAEGETEKTFQVHTYRAGVAAFTATQRGTNHVQKFQVTASGFSPLPNPAHTLVGDSVTVEVQRFGAAVPQADDLMIEPVDLLSPSIAKIDASSLQFLPGDQKRVIHAIGLAEGEAQYLLRDAAGATAILRVIVGPKQVGCLMQGNFNSQFTVTSGFGHAGFFAVSQVLLRFAAAGTTASLSSNHPNVPSGSGLFDPATCSVPLMRGTATLVGYPGIEFEFRNVRVDPASGGIRGEYAAGTNGALPGGYAIIYDFIGTLVPPPAP